MDIYEAAVNLNALIRKFDPNHDDKQALRKKKAAPGPDPRQLSLIEQ